MSVTRAMQLYEDVQTLVKQDGSGQLVEDGMAAVFNANLEEAKKAHPDDKIIAAIPEARGGNTRMAELLTSLGQLTHSLQKHASTSPPPGFGGAVASPRRGG